MSDFPFTMIGFDLDGTLVDSNPDIGPSINHALALLGREAIPKEHTSKLIGGGAALMLERAFELTGGPVVEADFQRAHQAQQAYYEANIAVHTQPYEGCLVALDNLARLDCALAVVTNKRERFAVKLLEELGLTSLFACILGGDSLGTERAKPAPDMIHEAIRLCGRDGRFAMVGDSSYDVRAARAAGVPCTVFSFGYNDAPAHELGADAVLDHFDELVPALHRL